MKNNKNYPFVSVILPIKNESEYIQKTINSIIMQDYPRKKLELLIADGMSSDSTRSKVLQIKKKNPGIKICLIENKKQLFASGFNLALPRSKGEFILLMGGHCQIATNYIRKCIENLLIDNRYDCVGGKINTITKTNTGRSIKLAMSSSFGVGNVLFRLNTQKSIIVDTVAFGVYRKATIDRCGLMDEELVKNQDDDFNYRINKMGGKILLDPTAQVTYYSRDSLGALWKQYFNYGLWKIRILQKNPRQMQARQFMPGILIMLVIIEIFLACISMKGMILLLLTLTLYLTVNLCFSISLTRKNKWKSFIYLPVTFAVLHYSYGIGFLTGLFRFAHRWVDRDGITQN
jgi:succinoglycan biosynthesis protein ExoA